ncbi:hypothetical protein D9615_007159 [Tricholomella constricta]|uniref:F-box domain-containing protein n=1 Tax=Tricholomella constricta TaxID=117010 RepID=A0A8H5H7S4_9AGAR|nr:hypothetical protein D9615_007159 [Tricholomella constricta]
MQDADIPGITHGASCHSAPEVKKSAYEQIWREIDSLEASIRALKRRHNALSITARLPPEILSEIFDWTATMLHNESSRWIRTSFVCSHWRRVALGCPKLWRRVSCTSPEQLKVLLPRTGVVPLEINLSIVTHWTKVEILQGLQEVHRVRKLGLARDHNSTRGGWESMAFVLSRLTQPAPLLEELSVVLSASPEYSQLPDNLFTGHAPQLRTLELVGCIVPNTSPVLTNITSLKLRGTGQVPQISLAELLIMLESLPNIQALELNRVHDSIEPIRTVHLPHLHHLDISYDQVTCAALLSCLKYPITTTQKIKTRYGGHLDGLRSLGVILATRTCPIAYVQVYKASTVGLAFKCWEGAGTRLQLPADDPHIHIEVSSLIPCLTPLRAVWQALPMAGLESLFISGNFSDDVYFGDFGNLSSLKTVRVEDAAVKFLRALEQGLPDCGLENNEAFPFNQELAEPGKLSFRSLRTLVLGGQYVDLGKMGIRKATEFTRCFRERRKRGVPLRKLYISKSLPREGIDGEITDIFHTVVKEVHWGLYNSGLGCGMYDCYSSWQSSEGDQDSEEEDME